MFLTPHATPQVKGAGAQDGIVLPLHVVRSSMYDMYVVLLAVVLSY